MTVSLSEYVEVVPARAQDAPSLPAPSNGFVERNRRLRLAAEAERRVYEWLVASTPAPYVVGRFGMDALDQDVPAAQRRQSGFRRHSARPDFVVALPSFFDQGVTRTDDDLDLSGVLCIVEVKSRGRKATGWKFSKRELRMLAWQDRLAQAAQRQHGEHFVPELVPPLLMALCAQDERDPYVGLVSLDRLGVGQIGQRHARGVLGWVWFDWQGQEGWDQAIDPALLGRVWFDLREGGALWRQPRVSRPRFVFDWAAGLLGGPARPVDASDLPGLVVDAQWAERPQAEGLMGTYDRPPSELQLNKAKGLAEKAGVSMPLLHSSRQASRFIDRYDQQGS